MLFSFSFAIIALLHLGVHGQNNDNFQGNNVEKGYPFGKLRVFEDGKNEELISSNVNEKSSSKSDSPSSVQPLPSPCMGTSSGTKLVHPKDKTKYIQCRDEYHYEIFTCPNGGEYIEQTNSCDLTVSMVDKCEQEKPCLNDGQCISFSNSTYKCTCRGEWTGERCDTPISSCARKPCGPNADCRPLKTIDYEQDYICVCHGTRGYGLNCQETVSNPCLSTSEQFFSYAFSQRAYIQCDGELIYFQPCGPSLYWSQEEKICDRKRPPKIDMPALLTKYATDSSQNQQINDEEPVSTTTEEPEQQKQFAKDKETVAAFVPARVTQRQQFQTDVNRQQTVFGQNGIQNEQQTQEIQRPPMESGPIRQDFSSRAKQWPNRQLESNNLRQSAAAFLSGPSQSSFTNTEQRTRTLPEDSGDFNADEPSIKESQQQQNFPQQKQTFGTNQWLNQVPEKNTQNNQRFTSNSQSWQGTQNQPLIQNQNQKLAFDATTKPMNTVPQTITLPEQSKQIRPEKQFTNFQSPQPADFSSQNFGQPSTSWQTSQSFPNQVQNFVTTTPSQFQGSHNFNTQFSGSQSPQSIGFAPQQSHNFAGQAQPWPGSQTVHNQQPFLPTTTFPTNVNPFPAFQNPNTQVTGSQGQQSTGFHSQNFANQQPSWQNPQTLPTQQQPSWQNPQTLPTQQQPSWQNPQTVPTQQQPSWQNPQTVPTQQQPSWQNPQTFPSHQQPFIQTTTFPTNVNPFPAFQNPNTQVIGSQTQQPGGFQSQNFASQQPSWQNPQTFPNHQPFIETATIPSNTNNGFPGFQNPNIPFNGNQGSQVGGFNNQNFNPQVQPWKKQNQQTTTTTTETSTVAQTTVRPPVTQTPNTVQQDQSWQNKPNAPLARNQFTQTATFNPQNNQNFLSQQQTRLNSQQFPNEQQPSMIQFEEPIVDNSKKRLNTGIQQNDQFTSDKQNFPQQWSNKVSNQNIQNNQRFASQSEFQNQNQQNFLPTTTIASNINRFQGSQKPNTQGQSIQTQPNNAPSSQVFAFQPKPWQDTSKQTFNTNPSADNQNTQFQNQDNPIDASDSLNRQSNQGQITGEQRKTPDTIPTVLPGSWKSRV